jgi:hypothetical protein
MTVANEILQSRARQLGQPQGEMLVETLAALAGFYPPLHGTQSTFKQIKQSVISRILNAMRLRAV